MPTQQSVKAYVDAQTGTLNTTGIWSHAVRPGSEHASSNYLTSLTGWAEWEPGAADVTAALDSVQGAEVTLAADTTGFAGYYLALPADAQFTVTVPIHFSSRYQVATQRLGLAVAEDLAGAPTTADLWVFYQLSDSSNQVRLPYQHWTSYLVASTTPGDLRDHDPASFRLMRLYVDRTGETVSALVSTTGRRWIRVGAPASTAGQTLSYVALVGDTDSATDTAKILAEFVQFKATSDPYHSTGGLVTVE